MTNPQEPDFFETLAGKQKGHAVAEALREAIQAETDTIKQAGNANLEKLPDYEMARLEVIKKQLIRDGVLKQNAITKPSTISIFLAKLKKSFSNSNWAAGFSVTASILVVSTILFRQQPAIDDSFNPDAIRGSQEQIITMTDPQNELKTLEEKLTNAGAVVVVAQINDNEWTLEIDVADKSKIKAVIQLLADSGIKVTGLPPYQVSIKK